MKATVLFWLGLACFSAVALAQPTPTELPQDFGFDAYNTHCFGLPDRRTKIQSCLQLIEQKKIGSRYVSAAYMMVATTYSHLLNDYDRAIGYQRLAINAYPKQPPPPNKDDDRRYRSFQLIGYYAGFAASYQWLGRFQTIKSLAVSIQSHNMDESFAFQKAAVSSFTMATLVDPIKHDAYAELAKALDRLCKDAEAERSLQRAIELAEQQNDHDAVDEYKGIFLGGCPSEFKDREEK